MRFPGLRALAVILAALTVMLTMASIALYVANARWWDATSDWIAANVGVWLAGLALSAVGTFVALRRPGNIVGWLISLGGLLVAASSSTVGYAGRALDLGPDEVPRCDV
jgi:hypothetical protein